MAHQTSVKCFKCGSNRVERLIDAIVAGLNGVCWTDRVSATKLANGLDSAGLLRKEGE